MSLHQHITALNDLRLGVELDQHNLPDAKQKLEALDEAISALSAKAQGQTVAYLVDGRVEKGLTFDKAAAETMALANCGSVRALGVIDPAEEQAPAYIRVATSCADHVPGETGYCDFSGLVASGTKLYAKVGDTAVAEEEGL